VGFLDYAWAVSLQKDNTRVKIRQDETLTQPSLELDNFGFTIKLPTAHFLEDGQISFLEQKFPSTKQGKNNIGRLFRASVLHLTAHTLAPFSKEKIAPNKSDPIPTAFAKSLINDAYVLTHMQEEFPEKLVDVAFANAFAYQKIKTSERIFTSSTKVMAATLTQLSVSSIKGTLETEQKSVVNQLVAQLKALNEPFLSSVADKNANLDMIFDETVKILEGLLEPFGPFLEAPSLRHTESVGRCSIYSNTQTSASTDFEGMFRQSLETLQGKNSYVDAFEEFWRPEQEAEALQAFNSDQYQKLREEKILAKINLYLPSTRFRSVSFPEEDYTQYLRARSLVQGASRRLLDIMRSAFNYLDEDPRQEMGQLDLPAVIQSLASSKPATDVFVLDEYLKPSFAWSLIFDVSSSMQVKGEYGRALAIAVAEAAKELMTDPTSWTFFAFSDRLYILKDSTESYSKRVRARIGGLKFEGLTYIPDAVHMAGKMLAKRFEEQRCLIVISDGWPYGYPDMPEALKRSVDDLLRKGVIVLGIGVETDRMGKYFQLHSSIYTQKDLINKLGSLYANASAKALET
jgi:hypothetical protein